MKDVKMRHIGMFLPLVLLMLVVAVSCERNEMDGVVRLSSNKILYDVGWSDGSAEASSATKAGEVGECVSSNGEKEFLMTYGEDSLFMYISQEKNRSFVLSASDEERQTKASALTAVSSFNVAAFTNSGNAFIAKDKIEVNASGKGSSNRYWPESDPLNFFAWASSVTPVFNTPDEAVTSAQQAPDGGGGYNLSFSVVPGTDTPVCGGMFDYVMPTPGEEPATATDATNQPDLIFAISPDRSKNDGTEVNLVFHHALSALVFKVGTMPADIYLNSIAIEGVFSSGRCSMSPGDNQNVIFEWEQQSELKNYTEKIDKPAVAGEQMGGEDAIFMMIPQTFEDEARLVLKFSISEQEFSLEKKLKEIITGCEADKKYVFTIGIPDEIDVDVDDQVVGAVKKDVSIKNTGNVTGYIRAAIVGYWTNNKGDITMPWVESNGEFVWGSEWSTYWKKGNDGFYYYLRPVPAKSAVEYPLFETYTLKTSTDVGTGHAFQTLKLNIAVQIIKEEDKSSWPEISTL